MLDKLENPVYWLAILSGLKLITDASGFPIISDHQVNAVADGVASLITVIAGIIALVSTKEKNTTIKSLRQYGCSPESKQK